MNIDKTLEELSQNPNIEVLKNRVGRAFETEDFDILNQWGFIGEVKFLPRTEEMISNFSFYWRFKKDERFGGEGSIQNLSTIFKFGWPDKLWFDNLPNIPYKDEFDIFSRNLYGFDDLAKSMDSTRIAAFYIDKTKLDTSKPLNPDIWLYNADDPKYLLTLNFREYLDKLTVTKGSFGWQTFFLDWDRMDFNDPMIREVVFPSAPDTTEMEEFLEYMPQIFPDQDYTEYQQLYDNWKAKAKQYGF